MMYEHEPFKFIKVRPYELGYDLAKGLVPALEMFKAKGGYISSNESLGSKPVPVSGNPPSPELDKIILALKLVDKSGDFGGVSELTKEEQAQVREGMHLFADNIGNLWI